MKGMEYERLEAARVVIGQCASVVGSLLWETPCCFFKQHLAAFACFTMLTSLEVEQQAADLCRRNSLK